MRFKDTIYGDLTGKDYYEKISVIHNDLKSLEGSPKKVMGDFVCSDNLLTSLKGRPQSISGNNGDFNCENNILTTLEGRPEIVNGDFNCQNNKLTNLIGSPRVVNGSFICSNNPLTSLEGCPKNIYDYFCFYGNTTIKDIKKEIIINQIKAKEYFVNDYETFTFEDIKDDFKKYGDFLLKTLNKKEKEEQLKKNKIIEKKYKDQKILETKQKSNYDYGLGI